MDNRAADAARVLAMDAVEEAGNGHPGTAMALAPLAHLLYRYVLRHDPANPEWLGRDRLILSCGHASMLLYSQLYLNGYDLTLDDLRSFRKFESRTPGHPEFRHTAGVEMTTGPLGQGVSTSVGVALGARYLRNLLDPRAPKGESPFDHRTFVIASDGDLQEGVASESASLAGHQKLSNLVIIWDDNRISIDGETWRSFGEDTVARYETYGWQTYEIPMLPSGDVDSRTLLATLSSLESEQEKPVFIRLQTIIAYPAPKARDTAAAHGAPLGASEVAQTKQALGYDPAKSFDIPQDVLAYTRQSLSRGADLFAQWQAKMLVWRQANPESARLFDRLATGGLPAGFTEGWPDFKATDSMSTRKASGEVLQVLAQKLPELWGGSADLTESNSTALKGATVALPEVRESPIVAGPEGRYVHFGVREHAMAAALNGAALSGLLRPFGGTFLIFSDYQRPAIRLAAIMGVRSTFVWSHDSIGLGEDGPTHQPVEQLWSLRAIPSLDVIRPADATETAVCWQTLIERNRPCGIALTRQNVPVIEREGHAPAAGAARGGYVVAPIEAEQSTTPDVLLMATGSEVHLALTARQMLAKEKINAWVISLPCLEWFAEQTTDYQDSVLPPKVRARVSIEAGSTLGWFKYLGSFGIAIGVDDFGASGAPEKIYQRFGLTPNNIVAQAKKSIQAASSGA